MKLIAYFTLFLLLPLYNYAQEYAGEMHNIKGHPTKVKLIFKPPLHHDGRWKYIYLFNDSGKIKQQSNFLKGKLAADYYFEYDKSNRLIVKKCYDHINHRDTAEVFIHKYLVDDKNQVLTEQLYHQNTMSWTKDSINYNQSGLPTSYKIKTPCFYKDSICITESFYFTYHDNKLISSNQTSNLNSVTERFYEYNDKGFISIIKGRDEVSIKNAETLEDDKLVSGFIIKYEYKYDKYGNWVKRYASKNNAKLKLDLVRIIKYRN